MFYCVGKGSVNDLKKKYIPKPGDINNNYGLLLDLMLLKIKYLKFMYGVGNSIQSLGAEYVGTLVFLYSE